MKGQTNATERAVTVKTGVTIAMLESIPDDVPWDLRIIFSIKDKLTIHGIGPVSTTQWMPIYGTGHYVDSTSYTLNIYSAITISDDKIRVTSKRIAGNQAVSTNNITISDTSLANAKLYLYGGGEPELLTCTVSMMEAVA